MPEILAEGATTSFDIGSIATDLATQAGTGITSVVTAFIPVAIIGALANYALRWLKKIC